MQLLQLLDQPALPSLVAVVLTPRGARARRVPALLQVTELAVRGSSKRLHVESRGGKLFR